MPLPLARKERFLELVWPGKLRLAMRISTAKFSLAGLSLRFRR
jgi:hypothetical protein